MSKFFSSKYFLCKSLAASVVAGLLSVTLLWEPAQARDYQFLDAELHYFDPQQRSDGMALLLKNMDEANIGSALLTGFAVTKKWAGNEPKRPRFYASDDASVYWYSATDMLVYDAVKSVSEKDQKRFYPFITGFNPTDLNAVEHIERLLKRDPGFWKGIGEVFTRHDELTSLTDGEKPLANHTALLRVYALAAKHDLPVLLHSNLTSTREPDFIFLPELKDALESSPDTTFIWAHAGVSAAIDRRQTLKGVPELVNDLLGEYENLNILLSWTLVDYLYDEKGAPKKVWLDVVKAYPDRFVIGSDVVGRFNNLNKYMDKFRPFLDALPEDIAHQVASTNLLQWLPPQDAKQVH
ncbi:amidohydrolase family protein [Litoribrevibacter euphylliae]|uniref:Amidohydrolase family protein n=1 Tax=Litoribrevibacter euphylliae TaxID=1834034 RepID=A0ABV7H782_9GAMM